VRKSRRRLCVLCALSAIGAFAALMPAATHASANWRVAPLGLSPHVLRSHPASTAGAAVRAIVTRTAASSGTWLSVGSPSSIERSAGDGIALIAPANGSSLPASAPISFSWLEGWYCPGCDGVEALIVATDPSLQHSVYLGGGQCPASSSPSCPTQATAGPFPAGTYYWAVGLKLGNNPTHASDVWSFTVTGSGSAPTAPAPTTGTTFTDATGDASGAPDIAGATVSNDAAAQITIQVNVPGEQDLAADEAILLVLDTDQNPNTGAPNSDGGDFLIIIDGQSHTWAVAVWDGSKFVFTASPTGSLHFSNGPVISINRSDLGGSGVTGFNFWVETLKGTDPNGPYDDAPNDGVWNFQLSGVGSTPPATPSTPSTPSAPVTPPAATKAATVTSIKVLALPTAPTAGLLFRVLVPTVTLSTGVKVHPDSAGCAATLTGKALRGTGAGRCTFAIPKTAGGKTLVVHVNAKYNGMSKSKTVGFRVRRR
jgi:hypothetical protein